MKPGCQLQLRIKEVPASINPTPRPSTSGGRALTSGGRQGTPGASLFSESMPERPEVVDYDAELACAYNSVIGAKQIEEASEGQNLDDIICLSLKIDTVEKSISSLGSLVPNLRDLILDHSRIASIRDLGVDLRCLLTISLNDCCIDELDGIGSLTHLKTLSLRNNSITDVSPLAMHDHLESLDLHGNRIYDISAGDILSSCPKLVGLTLSKNPINRAPNYRFVVCALIPQLIILDGETVSNEDRAKVTNAMILDASAAMNQIREDMEDEERLELCILDTNSTGIMLPKKQNSFSSQNFNNFSTGTNVSSNSAVGFEPDTGSELTHGSDVVLAGGVAAAMRRRRANKIEASTGNPFVDTQNNVIETLDSMSSRHYTSPSTSFDGPVSSASNGTFLQEGDLTLSVLGHQPRPGTSSGRPGTSSSPRPLTTSRRTPKSGSQSPVLPSSLAALERRKNSNRRLVSEADESLNNVSFPDPFARPNSGGKPPRSPLLGTSTSSPRASSPFQHNETRPNTTMSSGRPFTSYSSYSDDGANLSELAISAPSAPFKVSVPLAMRGEDLSALRSRLAPPSTTCSEDEADEDHDTVMSGKSSSTRSSTKQPPLRVSTARQSMSHSSLVDYSEYDNDQASKKKKSQESKSSSEDVVVPGTCQVKGIALLKSNSSNKTSIVHRDVVKRRNFRNCIGGRDNEEYDDDDEDILVDHNSRHNLMMHRSRGLHGSGTQSPKISSRGAKLGADLMAQMSGSPQQMAEVFTLDDKTGVKRAADSGSSDGIDEMFSSRPPMAPPTGGLTLSSIAGRSLGFDLSGSLAAINQWVEEMDTGGSSDEEIDDSRNRKMPRSTPVHSSFQSEDEDSGASGTRGREEKSFGEIIAARSTTGLKEDKSETSSHGSRSYNSANREILSRQKILSMCVGKDDKDADDLSLENDILFINVDENSSKHKSLTSNNLATHGHAHSKSSEIGQTISYTAKGASSGSTTNIAILKPSEFNTSVETIANSSRSTQKYGGAFGDKSVKLSKRDEVDTSEDDDEGDLNDLYAENLRMLDVDAAEIDVQRKQVDHSSRVIRASPSELPSNIRKPPSSVTKGTSHISPDFEVTSPRGNNRKLKESPRDSTVNLPAEKGVIPGSKASCLTAAGLSDSELVEMLNKPPKTTYALRTKSNFQNFFRGMESERMQVLLETAYAGEENEVKRKERVERRMDLLRDVLV